MLKAQVAAKIRQVHQRMELAAVKSGRASKDVRLVAISKYAAVGDGMVDALVSADCLEIGESRPQRLLEKAEYYADLPIRWHLIGTLQRNKVRKILPMTSLIHSLDSLQLAEAIDRIAEEEQLLPVHCLLEVTLSHDAEKHGILPENVLRTLDSLGACKNIVVAGLMGMSGAASDETQIHREFALLRKIAESARERQLPPNSPLSELSMGMSGDFEIAIEEGATIVRIGSLLYP